MRIAVPALLAVAGILLAAPAQAQTGGLEVVVTDAAGQPLDALVTIRHAQGYVKETGIRTNRHGVAAFPVLRATGSAGIGYSLTIAAPGFAPQLLDGIRVRIGEVSRVSVGLSTELIERVAVDARSDVVDLDHTAQATKFTDEFIADLPVPGRFYQNVLTLAPGVQDADSDGNPNVHGARDRDFKAVVSGIANVDPLTGQRMFDVNPNSIEEMEVVTAGAGVEFRRAQGGFARILQKQGSNDFEGVFELYFRSGLLDGDGAGDFSDVPPPEFETYQPSIQVSGPILKDKLWYRLSHEWVHEETPLNVTDGIEIVTDERTINSDQITWQVSPRNKLAFQFQSDPRTITNFGVSSFTPAESSAIMNLGGDTYSLTWTAPYSPKVLIESQVAWQDLNIGIRPTAPGTPPTCLEGPSFLESARCFEVDSGQYSGPYPFDVQDHRQRLTVRGDATVFGGRILGATHQLKLGMSIENERYFRSLTQAPDVSMFIETFSLAPPGGGPHGGSFGDAVVFGNFPVPATSQIRASGVSWGVYVEDQIKPAANLTLTAGLAVDREEIDSQGNGTFDPPAEFAAYNAMIAAGQTPEVALQRAFTAYEDLEDFYAQLALVLDLPYQAIFSRQTLAAQQSGFWDQSRRADDVHLRNTPVSPFLSLAWDPWSNGKTKLAATARRYYGSLFLGLPLLEIDSPTAYVELEAEEIRGRWTILPGSLGLRNSVSPSVNVDAVARDLKTPYNDELSLFFEREIATETSVRLTYIQRQFRDQLQDVDLNHVPLDAGRCNATSPVPGDQHPVVPPGDGILDDCAGDFRDRAKSLPQPDGILDLYVQNPGWGNLLLVGNVNSIDYHAYVLELVRRQYRNWELQGSYTFSRAIGDGEDYNQGLGNDPTLIEDERGYQAYDQRHVVKVSATTVTPWGLRLGGTLGWQSGLPYSILVRKVSYDQVPPPLGGLGAEGAARPRTSYPTGQRNSERNVAVWDVGLRVSREFRAGGMNGQVSVEVFNLLNDGTYQVYSPFLDAGQQVNGNNEALRRFGRRWQLGVRLAF